MKYHHSSDIPVQKVVILCRMLRSEHKTPPKISVSTKNRGRLPGHQNLAYLTISSFQYDYFNQETIRPGSVVRTQFQAYLLYV